VAWKKGQFYGSPDAVRIVGFRIIQNWVRGYKRVWSRISSKPEQYQTIKYACWRGPNIAGRLMSRLPYDVTMPWFNLGIILR
jgi:alkylated DNA nucleotide flippase Atl1